MRNSIKRVGILGHVGNGNLGDEAIITATIQSVRARCPGSEVYGFTLNPEDTRTRHQIPTFPIRRHIPTGPRKAAAAPAPASTTNESTSLLKRIPIIYSLLKYARDLVWCCLGIASEAKFLLACYMRLRRIDFLIIAGSHQLNDFFGGPWDFPYTLLKWACLARLVGARIAVLSVGAGPIDSRLGRQFIRWTLALCRYQSYRDPRSLSFIRALKAPGQGVFVPDLVFGLSLPKVEDYGNQSRPVVGINPVPYFDMNYWYRSEPALYDKYIHNLAALADFLIDKGYSVWLFPTQVRADPAVIHDIRAAMSESSRRFLLDWPCERLEDILAGIKTCRFVVASRYHAILLSALLSKAVLTVAYHIKAYELMAIVGLPAYAVDAGCGSSEQLSARFLQIEANEQEIVREIASRLPAIRQAVLDQYHALLFS
jgi:polysaccharide pyruvyl transferase WcaK-like protein